MIISGRAHYNISGKSAHCVAKSFLMSWLHLGILGLEYLRTFIKVLVDLVEHLIANSIYATSTRCMMGRLDACILIGLIVYGTARLFTTQLSIFSYFYSIVERAEGIARELLMSNSPIPIH